LAVAGLPNFPLPTTRTFPSSVGTTVQSVSRANVLSPTAKSSDERSVTDDMPDLRRTRMLVWLVWPTFVPS
jgi:hypothetical protein